MVSQGSITAMIVQVILGIIIPLALVLYFRKTSGISYRAIGVGILVFFIFSQVLEKGLHYYVLSVNKSTVDLFKNPWLFAIYGGLAAGIFEEVGRWLGFSLLLKNRHERKDGISLGIGHGGIEAFLIAIVSGVQGIVFATMINAGKLEQSLGAGLPPEQVAQLKERLIHTAQSEFWLGGLERIPAIFMQIAFSLIVLYGVRYRKSMYLLYAILLHALVDFAPAMYQAHFLSLWVAEIVIWVLGIGAIVVIVKSKKWFG
ncbi:YhfC family intramembrane metalloprotease [Paenibacillus sp. LMG 31456]|uniref:YhfC family intramembrane metalloprotease n=1 Tax=Paenibacillus foliorum TaxID=2654974 RepID=A0A972GW90_9BACL|nr:YhfC family intramembrane metalloprotease [Paenibacillus foliorum]NOU98066.1 YhfC family intramembrane metalloprotease [Paenibacillus foliorum]